MLYTVKQISTILGTHGIVQDPEATIIHISIDSRAIVHPSSCMFVALPGGFQDGHDFIQDAHRQGVRTFLVQRASGLQDIDEFVVEDVQASLQKIASYHRRKFRGQVIGITGSNGKTTVKEWLYRLIPSNIKAWRSPMSYNSQIGVPLSVLGIDIETDDLAIIEAGISRMGEMDALSEIIKCTVGIFTMIGDAHSAGFSHKQQKLDEKLSLFKHAKTIVYNRDHQEVHTSLKMKYPDVDFMTISFNPKADANILLVLEQERLKMIYKEQTWHIPFRPRSLDEASNLGLAIAAGLQLQISAAEVFTRCQYIDSLPMRLEVDHTKAGAIIINDSYTADISSLTMAFEHVKIHGIGRTKTVVLSEFMDTKEDTDHLKKLAQLISQYQIDQVMGVGKGIAGLSSILPDHIPFSHYDTVEQLINQSDQKLTNRDLVLIKGARRHQLERYFLSITSKLNETVLEVDLRALGRNLNLFSRHLHPTTKIMAMVKASAYGAGLVEVAQYLEFRNIDMLGVAFVDEAVQLRESGIRLPIFVLSPDLSRLNEIRQHSIEIAINSVDDFENASNSNPGNLPIKVHINLDTGMNRLGIKPQHVNTLIDLIKTSRDILICGIFSHLAAADDSNEASFTKQQNELFVQMSERILNQVSETVVRHISNTAGVINYPEFQHNMVRLGIGLYGVSRETVGNEELEPVFTLRSVIKSIRDVGVGETIGYNRKWRAKRPSKIATLPIGYADGLMRNAGINGYKVKIHNTLAPIVGYICMDITLVDVTDIDAVDVGDEVVFFDKDRPIDILAQANDTISYEIISRLSDRIKRLYIR